jgi:hypothetical protein
MGHWFETINDLRRGREALQGRRYGVIEAREGAFYRILLRPYPKIGSIPEAVVVGGWYHRHGHADRCLLYYNQPKRFPNFLVAKYFLSASATSLGTIRRVLEALDEIARIKGSDAILCDAANWRLSTAIMARLGWQSHCPSRWHRHFIRRFYGDYPSPAGWIAGGKGSGFGNGDPELGIGNRESGTGDRESILSGDFPIP